MRVRPVSTTKVSSAESSASTTANGATNLQRERLLGSANDGLNDAAEVSAMVIRARVKRRCYVRRQRTDAFIPQCCRIATIPRRAMHPDGRFPRQRPLTAASVNLDVQIAYLFAQRVAVKPE